MKVEVTCPQCKSRLSVEAGQTVSCQVCGNPLVVPEPVYAPRPSSDDDGGGGSSYKGWVIFILIFVVGNYILYATTGFFIFPLPRR
ncbi:MAG: hypothetical protein HY721_30815 [Planctomycetes bacterium]|nr:hypothetical protein [Planctomycetota bacterium]